MKKSFTLSKTQYQDDGFSEMVCEIASRKESDGELPKEPLSLFWLDEQLWEEIGKLMEWFPEKKD